MNTPNDLRFIMLATVPVHGYANVNVVTPVARSIVRLGRRLADGRWRRMINRAPENPVQTARRRAAELGVDRRPAQELSLRERKSP